MPGTKNFVNKTDAELSITLIVRSGDDPVSTLGYQPVVLKAGATQSVTYGGPKDAFLNGLLLAETVDGAQMIQQAVVSRRGGNLDNLLNTNSNIQFSYSGSAVEFTGSN